MIHHILPHGSKRRRKLSDAKLRLKRHRVFKFSASSYNTTITNQRRHRAPSEQINESVLFSIVIPCYNTPSKYLYPLVDSIFAQSYSNWQLVLVDASDDENRREEIEAVSQHDTRILYKKVANKGIAANTNVGIALATGDYICFSDHDDVLDPHALYENAKAIAEQSPDILYSDEDKISDDGSRYFEPHFKPDFSIDLLHSVNYITHFVCVRRSLVEKINGIREGFEGAQDFDFLLRATEQTDKIVHIPKLLYHWRQADNSTAADFSNKMHVMDAGAKALTEHYARTGVSAEAVPREGLPGFYSTKYKLTGKNKRAVVVILPDTVNQVTRNFVVESYRKAVVEAKMNASVIEAKAISEVPSTYDSLVIVQDVVVPVHPHDNSLNAMFGAVENEHVEYATIKTVSKSRIVDCGYVYDSEGALIPLFGGVDPAMPNYFGYDGWTRNVDGTSSRLFACLNSKKLLQDIMHQVQLGNAESRVVCFGEYTYQLFGDNVTTTAPSPKSRYLNPNLSFIYQPHIKDYDYLTDTLEIDT